MDGINIIAKEQISKYAKAGYIIAVRSRRQYWLNQEIHRILTASLLIISHAFDLSPPFGVKGAADNDVKLAIQAGYRSALAGIPATSIGEEKNGWQMVYDTGDYGTKYMFRATIAYMGLGANLGDDAFYLSSFTSSDAEKYSNAKQYVLHSNKGEIPPINGFWSITMYNDKALFAANPINRYTLGSLSDPPLITNPEGSIDIYIQWDSPDTANTTNWLPAPVQR